MALLHLFLELPLLLFVMDVDKRPEISSVRQRIAFFNDTSVLEVTYGFYIAGIDR